MDIKTLIKPYCPWLEEKARETWAQSIPSFRRPVFEQLIDDLRSIPQMLSITGPRRIGKSTLLQQMVEYLLNVTGIPAERIVYYSLDDPARLRMPNGGADIIDGLMRQLYELGQTGPAYLLLDEIQRLDRWELYLKKYYDLKYPVKVVISGSASGPIFKKSRESLLGRIKDYHIIPFSFREYLLYRFHGREEETRFAEEMEALLQAGSRVRHILSGEPAHDAMGSVPLSTLSDSLWQQAQDALGQYMIEGGFPEVWSLPSQEKKIEYLYDNQIKKVIYEDLLLAAEFRKPEQLKAFYISLLEQPGREVSQKLLAKEAAVSVQQVEKYLPLLEMTDLLAYASKFRSSAVRVRRGNRKFYLVDLALRNAVLRIGSDLLVDESMMGLYAENLVFNTLRKWAEILQIDYYRDGAGREVDFVVHTRPGCYLPVEVKYRESISASELSGLRYFLERHECHSPFVITKRNEDFGRRTGCFFVPLVTFLLMMD